MTDRELLEREIELLWGTDDLGRHEASPMAAVAAPRRIRAPPMAFRPSCGTERLAGR